MTTTLADAYDLVIFDLDGVVYLGDEAVPGAPEAIRGAVAAGARVVYVTNNASRRADEVARHLQSLGVPASADEVLTSARAAAQVLAEDLPYQAPVLVVGAPALSAELDEQGLRPVTKAEQRPVAVLQGYGPLVGWADLAEACVAIRAGARWVATNLDATLPSPRGPLPGNGSLVAMLSTALGGRQPDTVVGKPSPSLFHVAARSRGATRALIVGDRLDTDIAGADQAGMDSLLVLTGVTGPAELLRAAAHERPTYVAPDCGALSTSDDLARVPGWDADRAIAELRGWTARYDTQRLTLAADGPIAHYPADALRVLAAAAWRHPDWVSIIGVDSVAEQAVEALGLVRFAGWSARPVSAT